MSAYAELSAQVREPMREWWKSTGWKILAATVAFALVSGVLQKEALYGENSSSIDLAMYSALAALIEKFGLYCAWILAGVQVLRLTPKGGWYSLGVALMQGKLPLIVLVAIRCLIISYVHPLSEIHPIFELINGIPRGMFQMSVLTLTTILTLSLLIKLRSVKTIWFLKARALIRDTAASQDLWWRRTGSWLLIAVLLGGNLIGFGWDRLYHFLAPTYQLSKNEGLFSPTCFAIELVWLLAALAVLSSLRFRAPTTRAAELLLCLRVGSIPMGVYVLMLSLKSLSSYAYWEAHNLVTPHEWLYALQYSLRLGIQDILQLMPEMLLLFALLIATRNARLVWWLFASIWVSDIVWSYFSTFCWHPAKDYDLHPWPWLACVAIGLSVCALLLVGTVRHRSYWLYGYVALVGAYLIEPVLHPANAYAPTAAGTTLVNLMLAIRYFGAGPYGKWLATRLYDTNQTMTTYVVSSVIPSAWSAVWAILLLLAICMLFGVRLWRSEPPTESLALSRAQPT